MKSHIAIVGNKGALVLKTGAGISFTEKNPMFNNVEMFSAPFELPFNKNRHLAKNIDDINSTLRASDIEGEQFRIMLDGLPVRTAVMKVQEDVVMSDALSVNLDATNKTFKDLIQDLRCRDIHLMDDIKIGEMLGDVHVSATGTVTRTATYFGGRTKTETGTYSASGTVNLHGLGFSYPAKCKVTGSYQHAVVESTRSYGKNNTVNVPEIEEIYINVSDEYGANSAKWGAGGAKYCNMRVCYKHHAVDADGQTSDDVIKESDSKGEYEDMWPYWVLDAQRPMSGICFYVLYFLDCLFHDLGIAWDNSELLKIEDMKHLAFASTQCHYRTELLHGTDQNPFFTESYSPPAYSGSEIPDRTDDEVDHYPNINGWMKSRGCGGKLCFGVHLPAMGSFGTSENVSGSDRTIQEHYTVTANIMSMYATNDNFPNVNVTEVIESLENAFGIRFLYDDSKKSCKAVFLRDMFKQQDAHGNELPPINFKGKVISIQKKTEKITGVRVCFNTESEKQEQQDNVRYGVRDYDTDYDYIDFGSDRVKFDQYANIVKKTISPTDENCYVDLQTGNAYRIKVDSDASNYGELRPVVFQVAHLHGIEEGDCSKENEDYVKEITVGFTPAILSDVSSRKSRSSDTPYSINALLVDEDMEHEFVTQKLCSEITMTHQGTLWTNRNGLGHVSCYEVLNLIESYDPTSTEYGDSPLQELDLGLTLTMMRGGGSDATIQNYDDGYDGFGNSRWQTVVGTYQSDIDTMDVYGNEYDYNGTEEGDGGGERFSLKPRAWKPFLYYIDRDGKVHTTPYDPSLVGKRVNDTPGHDYYWMIPCNDDEYTAGVLTKKIRTRGFVDSFLAELIHFYLYRQRYEVKALCTAAELADIPNKWIRRFNIDGKIGWMNQIEYNADNEKGIGEVTIDFYAI